MNFKIKTADGSAYLEQPCTEDKIQELCQTLCIENSTATKVNVDSVSLNAPADALFKGKTFNLDKLNYLAKRLYSFSGKETTTFYAVAYGQSMDSIDDLF